MHSFENLVRTRTGGQYSIIQVPDKITEGEHYNSFNELGVPEPVVNLVAFCNQHEIQIGLHRKPVTHGCIEAVQARSISCGTDVQLHQELKAVVLKTMENIKIAFYMCGDHELPKMVSPRGKRYGLDCDLLSSATGFSVLGMDDDPQLISGRINPVTLFLNFDDRIEHFFDLPDNVLNGPMYTNGGCNTWGIRIDNVSRMLTEVGALCLKDICSPAGVSRKVSAFEEAKTYRDKVA